MRLLALSSNSRKLRPPQAATTKTNSLASAIATLVLPYTINDYTDKVGGLC